MSSHRMSDNLNNITHTRNTPFTSNTGLTYLFNDCTTEANIFLKFVTKDTISYIIESTNEYAKLKNLHLLLLSLK